MSSHFFVAGTDTEVGKTFVSATLLNAFCLQGSTTLAMKPVASGCELIDGQWRNEDALTLMHFSSQQLAYEIVNPFAFKPAIAPHIAAKESGKEIPLDELLEKARMFLARESEFTLIEGAGGWYVPLNDKESFADFVKALDIPVILVVAIRLGCINHALLSEEAIKRSGLSIAGWVANHVDGVYERARENIESLQAFMQTPMLAEIPYIREGRNAFEKIERASASVPLDSIKRLQGY